ncbi:uncharacterized protein METZ01_LOCUS504396 [marine metagenome]|uniref:MIP18 family-like domain-containing protein n=1 Tax=marine metagenome TaxID=408172 RepID=A0A383E3Z4_9ZZZZ
MITQDDDQSVRDFMPDPIEPGELTESAGIALTSGAEVADKSMIIEALRTVFDPEIPVNIYDLGLVYRNDVDDRGQVTVEMTLTAPGCPVAGDMPQWVADAVAAVEGVGEVNVCLVWDPPWNQDMMSEEARLELGMF